MTRYDQRLAVIGNPLDGLTFAGPFESVHDVAAFMEDSGEPWQVAQLQSPEPKVEDLPPEEWETGLTMMQIGVIDNGIDGRDVYVQVKRVDGEYLTVELAEEFALSRMGHACHGPGTVFCDIVRGYKLGSPLATCLCVAEIRFDN